MHDQVHVGACARTSHITSLHSKLVLYACGALAPVDISADGPAQVLSYQPRLQPACGLMMVSPVTGKGCTGLLLITVNQPNRLMHHGASVLQSSICVRVSA